MPTLDLELLDSCLNSSNRNCYPPSRPLFRCLVFQTSSSLSQVAIAYGQLALYVCGDMTCNYKRNNALKRPPDKTEVLTTSRQAQVERVVAFVVATDY